MASGPIVGGAGGAGGDGSREKQRWADKVYTRKSFRGLKKTGGGGASNTAADRNISNNNSNINASGEDRNKSGSNSKNNEDGNVNSNKGDNSNVVNSPSNEKKANAAQLPTMENLVLENAHMSQTELTAHLDAAPEVSVGTRLAETAGPDSQKAPAEVATPNNLEEQRAAPAEVATPNNLEEQRAAPAEVATPNNLEEQRAAPAEVAPPDNVEEPLAVPVEVVPPNNLEERRAANGVVKPAIQRFENRIKISLSSSSKQERRELRKRLQKELVVVRGLVKKIEATEGQVNAGNSQPCTPVVGNNVLENGRLKRVYSDVGSVAPSVVTRPLHQLSVSVVDNCQGASDNMEKEKRTPKANQFYRNSEFLLAKDKFPPAESNKKSKSNGRKHSGNEIGFGFGSGKYFKSCSSLLERLMKHKHGWVFNSPVDVEGLGLHDYYSIIQYPMDLGTVKARLNKNWYKSPREFAEDVRLTFRNAMRYNPKGQDVHTMAEQLSRIFEDRWAIIENDYIRELRFAVDYEVGLTTPTSRKTIPALLPPTPLDTRRILDRSESMTHAVDPKQIAIGFVPSGRTPVPKKPKAKDPHKRDMTYEEKQKLSTNLQNLPSEKLDQIVQIIKKRNSALSQHDDEIEVDIDSVDTETLWELDRFVTNYKKSLSKNKRKAELAIQARAEAMQNVQEANPAPLAVEVPKDDKSGDINGSHSLPLPVGKQQADNASGSSSSSSSSSSDSGSSSSDSDSESSSGSGSDGPHSPRT